MRESRRGSLTGTAAELGVFRGEFSEKNLKKWRGALYVMIDSWRPSDCINGNSSHCIYGAGYDREQYDLRETKLRMARNPGFERRHRIAELPRLRIRLIPDTSQDPRLVRDAELELEPNTVVARC